MPQPTVGRIVHYRRGVTGPRAAIVAAVMEGPLVNLTVFEPSGSTSGVQGVPFLQPGDSLVAGRGDTRGCWAEWPEGSPAAELRPEPDPDP